MVGPQSLWSSQTKRVIQLNLLLPAVLCLTAAVCASCAAAADAAQQCTSEASKCSINSIIDLTVPVQAGMPSWERATGLPRNWRALSQSIDEGDVVNQSHLNMDAHTGTHLVSSQMAM